MDHHREHPAKAIQPEDGFDEGQRVTPGMARMKPSLASVVDKEKAGPTPEKLKHDDFARGQDSDLPTLEKEKEGRFSEGQEKLPHKDV